MEIRVDRWRWSARPAGPLRTLRRRGALHGSVTRVGRRRLDAAEARERWEADEPIWLRGALELGRHSRDIARTVSLFRRLRTGAAFEPEVWRRVRPGRAFEPAGVSVDLGDVREIEKVHADLRRGGRTGARDLWAKLSRISTDARDDSLRIRFSFGAERLDDWRTDARRAAAADDFAEAVFPECALLARNRRVRKLLQGWTGRKVRLSERIVFSNAPGGGAAFHHDAEPGQLGVAYAQLTGRTAWLALPKRALAEEVARLVQGSALAPKAGTPARALRALDREDLPELDRLLNRTPRLTRRLVELGALIVLSAGDVLLLPSHGPDDAAWHSVFALGVTPSVAHSYGVFPYRRSTAFRVAR